MERISKFSNKRLYGGAKEPICCYARNITTRNMYTTRQQREQNFVMSGITNFGYVCLSSSIDAAGDIRSSEADDVLSDVSSRWL